MAFADFRLYTVAIMLLIGIVNVWTAAELFRQLRTHHPDLYDNLGRPSFFVPHSMFHNEWPLMRFIIRREYSRLGDTRLKLFGDIFFLGNLINIVMVVLYFLLM
jgi:hypothetical protein